MFNFRRCDANGSLLSAPSGLHLFGEELLQSFSRLQLGAAQALTHHGAHKVWDQLPEVADNRQLLRLKETLNHKHKL